MRSDEWREKCNQRLEIARHKCGMCGRFYILIYVYYSRKGLRKAKHNAQP